MTQGTNEPGLTDGYEPPPLKPEAPPILAEEDIEELDAQANSIHARSAKMGLEDWLVLIVIAGAVLFGLSFFFGTIDSAIPR